jgi:hypothetical protein
MHPCVFTRHWRRGLAVLALGLSTTGCVAAAALPLAYAISGAGLAVTGTTMVAQTQIAQQNADTYRAQVLAQQAGAAPQCQAPEARTACPLYQVRLGVYRAKCVDGSGLETNPGRLTVIPPASERPHPWDAEACTL